jgi:hypothetical protein
MRLPERPNALIVIRKGPVILGCIFSYVVDRGGYQRGPEHPVIHKGVPSPCNGPIEGLTD